MKKTSSYRLIFRNSIPKYLSWIHWVLPPHAFVAGVAFHGIDDVAVTFFYDVNMITGAVITSVKEDNVAGIRIITSLLPLFFILKPLHTIKTVWKLMFNKLDLNKICTSISQKYGFQYDLSSMLANLIYARILSPLSKLSSFEYIKELMEPPPNLYYRISIVLWMSWRKDQITYSLTHIRVNEK